MFVSGKELQTDGIGLCWVFLSVDCAVNKKVRSNLPWDFTKNVKRLSLEFRTLLAPNFAILARVFQGVIFSRFRQANLKKRH